MRFAESKISSIIKPEKTLLLKSVVWPEDYRGIRSGPKPDRVALPLRGYPNLNTLIKLRLCERPSRGLGQPSC